MRRPQFKHANTVIASPASKSTARSRYIVPRHLSQVFMRVTVALTPKGAYPSEVRGKTGFRPGRWALSRPLELLVGISTHPASVLTGVRPSHRIVARAVSFHYV